MESKKAGCPQGQTNSIFISADAMAAFTFRPAGVMPPLPFGTETYTSVVVPQKLMQGMMCWIVDAGMSFQISLHG